MQLDFRLLSSNGAVPAAPGELLLRPAFPEDAGRLDFAALALEKGEAAFLRGTGPIERLVVSVDPTLDDMLAALIVQRGREGTAIPCAEAFARYTATHRQGVRPSDRVPLEQSLEGMFEAIRHDAGDPLSDPVRASRFLRNWARMAGVLWAAMKRGADPHREVIFGEDTPFEKERQFLNKDRAAAVYERDRAAGMEWMVHLPGHAEPVAGLLLRQPQSVRFKELARQDPRTPGKKGFRFLAVWWGKGDSPEQPPEWIFTTDPLDCLPIGSLAEALQKEEEARNPQTNPNDPWYDGKKFSHTLVAAPNGGTVLGENDVLAILRRWGRLRPMPVERPVPNGVRRPSPLKWASLGALVVLVAILGVFFWRQQSRDPLPPLDDKLKENLAALETASTSRGIPLNAPEVQFKMGETPTTVLSLPDQPGSPGRMWKLWVTFPLLNKDSKLPFSKLTIKCRDNPTREVKVAFDGTTGKVQSEVLEVKLAEKDNRAEVIFDDPTPGASVLPQGICEPSILGDLTLFIFTVGVGDYPHVKHLDFAVSDAVALTETLQATRGRPFSRVVVHPPLTDKEATREKIENELGKFSKDVLRDSSPGKMVIVLFSGHGNVVSDEDFIFLPYDFEEDKYATRLYWHSIRSALSDMKCPVLVVLDACHSGQAANQLLFKGSKGVADQEKAVRDFMVQKPGLMVLAAAKANQQSWENGKWKHGTLTLTLLELLQGHEYDSPNKPLSCLPQTVGDVIRLSDVEYYARERVKQLLKEVLGPETEQTVVLHVSPYIDKTKIPFTIRTGPR
jgi:hypothetical protein